jgi:spectinomycin phosphotransferase
MLEKPNLSEEKIITSLRQGFGIRAIGVEFLPLGNDSSAWAYQVRTERGETCFLKVKKDIENPLSLHIPRFLKEQGLEQAIAPYPTKTQGLRQAVGDYFLFLYPFVKGTDGMEIGLSNDQWIEYGAILKNLHAAQLPFELKEQIPKETFTLKWLGVIRKIQARLKEGSFADPAEQALAAFWHKKEDLIERIIDRAEELGRILQKQPLEFVLCHADIHTANLLITPDQKMFVVDWDETILAPRERDLMFIAGNSIGGEPVLHDQESLFFQGYGKIEINWTALAYYRYEWVVQDMGDYGERVFLMDDLGEITKQDALEGFISLFQPGDVVEVAFRSEENLIQ